MTVSIPIPLTPISSAQLPLGCLVVCATSRLAQTLASEHDKIAADSTSWASLRTTTFQPWLLGLYEAVLLRGQEPEELQGRWALDAFQERLVWEQVIHAQLDRSASMLFDISALATMAAEANALTINWNVSTNQAFANTEQTQFALWQSRFIDHCNLHSLIDQSRLCATLVKHLPQLHHSLPEHIVFAGFDHHTPLEQRLQHCLLAEGHQLYTLVTAIEPTTATLVHNAQDIGSECQGIARWAQECLKKNGSARIGIVVPDLATYQQPLLDALEDTIVPDWFFAGGATQPRPFNFSLGQPLSTHPVVHTALTLLSILVKSHVVEQPLISQLLLSPYWSITKENDARARLDAALRDNVSSTATLKRYSSYAQYLFTRQSLNAVHSLGYVETLATTPGTLQNQSRMPSEWRRTLQSTLTKVGWLAQGHLSSHEFQAREAFFKTFGKLAQLDQITGKVTLSRAVSLLTQLCSEQLFQPKTQGTPPIQILGVLEAAGQTFDNLWVAGLMDSVWPPAAKPNPLLSAEAQRQAGAPNSCASVQLDFARAIQKRLLHSAPEQHLSYPSTDGVANRLPSPLLDGFSYGIALASELPAWSNTALSSTLEQIDDAQAPPVRDGDKVSGGTSLLRAQAICPAWGYYQYRLGAKALAIPSEGLDPRKRGTLLHDTLEHFWKNTGSLNALQNMDADVRLAAVAMSAQYAIDQFNSDQKQDALKPRQALLEHQRLCRLVDEWLQLEVKREADFTVLEAEGSREINIEGIVAHLRIDRIDELEDGRMLVIDYKTGANIDTKNWAQGRITEPQLPIYATTTEHTKGNIAGVAFGQIHINGSGFKGIAEEDHLLPNVYAVTNDKSRKAFNVEAFPDWPSLLNHWRLAISTIAREIREGDASVRMTNEADIQYCDVRPLLRLAEREQQLLAAASKGERS